MESTNELLAMDTKGRVRVSLERREMLLREFDGCGLSAAAFARHVGVKYQTFIYWLKRRRESGALAKELQPRVAASWVEASVEAPGASSGEVLRVELPGGRARDDCLGAASASCGGVVASVGGWDVSGRRPPLRG